MTEDEMVERHPRLDGHEFEQAPGVGDGQGSLACCSPWGLKESDTTECLNWTWTDMENWRVKESCLKLSYSARRSNQSVLRKSVLNIHWKVWCWCWSSSTLATWCKANSLEKTLMLGKIEDRGKGTAGWDGWMESQTHWTWVWADSKRQWRTGEPAVLSPWGLKELDVA